MNYSDFIHAQFESGCYCWEEVQEAWEIFQLEEATADCDE